MTEYTITRPWPPPPPPPPKAPLPGGELTEQLTTPSEDVFQARNTPSPLSPADQGAAELPPATEGSQPATVEEEPVPPCPDGLVFDEETDLCVLEEPPVTETPEQQQPSEGQGSENNGNDNN